MKRCCSLGAQKVSQRAYVCSRSDRAAEVQPAAVVCEWLPVPICLLARLACLQEMRASPMLHTLPVRLQLVLSMELPAPDRSAACGSDGSSLLHSLSSHCRTRLQVDELECWIDQRKTASMVDRGTRRSRSGAARKNAKEAHCVRMPAFLNTCRNVSGSCAPLTAYRPLILKCGTPLMPV